MSITFEKLTIIIALLTMSAVALAENRTSVIVKTGSFTLANKTQIISNQVTFDEKSSSVFAIEYEYKIKDNLSLGGEYIGYKNTYASGTGTARFTHIMFNIRKLFSVAKHVEPFIGVGAGGSTVALGGIGGGTGGGFGFQLMAGVKFPFDGFSAVVEYKMIAADPDDEGGTSVSSTGNGLFTGVGISF